MGYILGIDQSTQGTKAILADANGRMVGRADRLHRQIINSQGWVSHDLEEIYQSVIASAKEVVAQTGIRKEDICAVGISNQRETTAIWNKQGQPLNLAVVWQCARAKEIVHQKNAYAEEIRQITGLPLSPYFPAAKMAWLLQNTGGLPAPAEIRLGTIDSWLIYRLTDGAQWKTDYSNASRTQLFDLHTLQWSEEICRIFGIPMECLPTVCDSNSLFGMTDLDGFLPEKVPIHSAMGDSHAALFGQGCHSRGMIKTTYGTGSSIMMNTGESCIASRHGLATSLAWGIDGKVNYVLEGNINYTGAVITWLKDDLQLIQSPDETEAAAKAANPQDRTVLVPAFSGLSAPYWNDEAKGMLYGMTRATGRKEIIRAALDSITLQIQAVLDAMSKDSGLSIQELGADGGPTHNGYLMQTQSDISRLTVAISDVAEVSALGAAYLAGISVGLYEKEKLFAQRARVRYTPKMSEEERQQKLHDWNRAIELLSR